MTKNGTGSDPTCLSLTKEESEFMYIILHHKTILEISSFQKNPQGLPIHQTLKTAATGKQGAQGGFSHLGIFNNGSRRMLMGMGKK